MGIKFDEKTKTWNAFYSKRHPETRQPKSLRRIKIKSKAEAKRIEHQLIILVNDALKSKTIPIWKDTVDKCCLFRASNNQSKKTINNYYLCLKKNTFDIWGNKRIDTISKAEIRDLISLLAKSKSVSHQINVLKFIRGTFNFAIEAGYINHNPSPNIKFKTPNKLKDVLTKVQAEHFLNKAKEYESEWYYHWSMALYTGMRSGELYALTWDKVNFDNRQILVDCSWNSVDGFKSTKSGNDRIVEIAPTLLITLKELKLKQLDNKYVLPRLSRWTKGSAAMATRMFLQGVGLPQVRFHDLRASWATIMLSNGIEPIKVMSMGGWESLKTMQRYVRKAGVNIKGITNNLELHNPRNDNAKVIAMSERSNL